MDQFIDEYLSWLEGDRDEPPRWAIFLPQFAVTAARGVDPYATRPSIAQLLAAHR